MVFRSAGFASVRGRGAVLAFRQWSGRASPIRSHWQICGYKACKTGCYATNCSVWEFRRLYKNLGSEQFSVVIDPWTAKCEFRVVSRVWKTMVVHGEDTIWFSRRSSTANSSNKNFWRWTPETSNWNAVFYRWGNGFVGTLDKNYKIRKKFEISGWSEKSGRNISFYYLFKWNQASQREKTPWSRKAKTATACQRGGRTPSPGRRATASGRRATASGGRATASGGRATASGGNFEAKRKTIYYKLWSDRAFVSQESW